MRQPLRRRRERRIALASDLTVTSMVDMFTMLLAFLLHFVDPSLGGASLLALPHAGGTGEPEAGIVLRISTVDVSVGDSVVAALPIGGSLSPDLVAAVTEALRAARPGDLPGETPLVVECDRTLPFALVGGLLGAARAAGFTRYRFAVERDDAAGASLDEVE